MTSFELPAQEAQIRLVSDSKKPVTVAATAAFVAKKPYIFFSKALTKRTFVEINFSGEKGGVYSE